MPRRRGSNDWGVTVYSNDVRRSVDVEDCPVCGRPMVAGFLTAARQIWWAVKPITMWSVRLGSERVGGGQYRPANLRSRRCTACGLVVSFDDRTG